MIAVDSNLLVCAHRADSPWHVFPSASPVMQTAAASSHTRGVVPLAEAANYWEEFQRIARAGRIVGPQVHDARIAALCTAHAVRELWSADRDFSRYAGIQTRNPLVS